MPLDPSIFQRGAAQRAQGNQQMVNVFQNLANQYIKGQQVKDASLTKQRADQAKLEADPKYRFQQLLTISKQRPLTAQEQAEVDSMTAIRGSENIIGAMGDVAPKYGQVNFGQQPAQQATYNALSAPVQQELVAAQPAIPARAGGGSVPSQANPPATYQEQTAHIGGQVKGTPKFAFEQAKQELDFVGKKMMQDIKDGKTTALKEGSKESLQQLVDRMRAINFELKEGGEIRGEEQGISANISSAIAGTGVGQAVEGVTDPKSQALRKEYEGLRSMMLPFFASASGLSAKSIDSEGERKAILDSFGDPTGLYESNEKLLDALSSKVGTGVERPTNINPAAIEMLKADPSKAGQFDEIFGEGMAKQVLGQ